MKHIKIMSRIILLFGVVIMTSFIPENNRDFFGDWLCQGGHHEYFDNGPDIISGCQYSPDMVHGPTWHWGFRHWMWFFMGISLFLYNLILVISLIVLSSHKYEN